MHAKENRKTILNAKEGEADKAVIISTLLMSLTIPLKINVYFLCFLRNERLSGGLQLRDTLIVKADAAT